MAVSLFSTLLLVFAAIYAANGNSSGAPLAACTSLSPSPSAHSAEPQTSAVPYSIDLSPFDDGAGGYQYTPGNTYTLTLSGNNGETFRGFLVQSRLVADDNSLVGTFTATAANSQPRACTMQNDAITHSNSGGLINFETMSMDWTAPPQGTGAIRFRFAVVQVRVTYWANQMTATVSEAPPPPQPSATPIPTVVTPEPSTTPGPETTAPTEETPSVATVPPAVPSSSSPTTPDNATTELEGTESTASASGVLFSGLSILLASMLATLLL